MDVEMIFLAEDDSDDVEFFQEALNEVQSTCTLVSSKNGKELLQKLNTATSLPQLIFLDVNMPVMNGLECLKAIREQDRFQDIPVIILTTSSSASTIGLAHKLGANAFIQKPSDFNVLKMVINDMLSKNWVEHTVPADSKSFVHK